MGGKSSDPNKAAMKAQKAQMERLDKLNLPELEEYILQNPELVGLLEAEQLDPSAMEDITTDPRLKADQMSALEGLRERSQQGLTAQDKFAMEELMGQVSDKEKSQRAAIEQEMQQRGTADSGTALLTKLQGGADASNQARQQAMQMAAQGQQQRMAALQNLGQAAGQMQSQDFAQQAQVTSAKDAIAKANAMNRQQVSGANLASRQNIENQRAAIANQQSQVKNQIAQQNFSNQMSKATGQGQVASNMSSIAANTPATPSAFQSALGGAATGASIGSAVPGIGTGVGAAVGAGAGLLGGMEDGGVIHAENGSEFMRDLSNSMTGQPYDTQVPLARPRSPLPSTVNDSEYMRDLNNAVTGQPYDTQVPFARKAPTPLMMKGVDSVSKVDAVKSKPVEKPAAEETKKPDYAKALAGLNSMFGTKTPDTRPDLKLSYDSPVVQNLMGGIAPQQFDNPMARFGQALENGGIPAYGCGGLHKGTMQAEDGKISFDSPGTGAVVGGDSFERDRVDARLNSGEAVLNVAQQQRLMDILKGKEELSAIGEGDIVEGVPKRYQDKLTNKIDGKQDLKLEGLKRLLKVLGEE